MANPIAEAITMAAITPALIPAASSAKLLEGLGQDWHPLLGSHFALQAVGHCVGVSTTPRTGSQYTPKHLFPLGTTMFVLLHPVRGLQESFVQTLLSLQSIRV